MVSLNIRLETTRGRILVVDDDPLIGELLTTWLEQEGFEVQNAQDGHAGLLAFFAGHFDLIFTDFRMPRLNGLELATQVRKIDPMVPIVLLTGEAYTLEADAAMRAGINRVVSKPFKFNELLTCLGLMKARWHPAA